MTHVTPESASALIRGPCFLFPGSQIFFLRIQKKFWDDGMDSPPYNGINVPNNGINVPK
jgi:hypothetical protein